MERSERSCDSCPFWLFKSKWQQEILKAKQNSSYGSQWLKTISYSSGFDKLHWFILNLESKLHIWGLCPLIHREAVNPLFWNELTGRVQHCQACCPIFPKPGFLWHQQGWRWPQSQRVMWPQFSFFFPSDSHWVWVIVGNTLNNSWHPIADTINISYSSW